ncbi:hypothetical protein CP533_4636 [Ophiocordyceps camponoti-saundersi (nom. inval.)]|nr:hypothetical protein CP533_4636 [Ophiocordyceps camponoti-saundersi (nom. inval.)]
MALQTVGESQDSQAIFDAHRALFGAGPLRTAMQACGNEALQGQSLAKPKCTVCLREQGSRVALTGKWGWKKQANAYVIDAPLAGRCLDAAPRQSLDMTRMEAVSQQTPTQTNSDRDYGAFCELTADEEERTLASGDTGAVNFGHLRPSSQLSEDGGLDTTRSEWRVAKTPLGGSETALETPRNPFAVAAVAPLVGTQLFGTTQQLSSVVRAVMSPTSSRPSPHDVAPPLTSTDDERAMSSPTQVVPRKEDELIPESPTERASKPGLSRGPSAHYEPMKKSQERKTIGGGGDNVRRQPSPDSDYDDVLLKADRRRRAERKRARAAEEMEKICFARKKRGNMRRSNSHEETTRSVQATPGDERTCAADGRRTENDEERIPATSPMIRSSSSKPRVENGSSLPPIRSRIRASRLRRRATTTSLLSCSTSTTAVGEGENGKVIGGEEVEATSSSLSSPPSLLRGVSPASFVRRSTRSLDVRKAETLQSVFRPGRRHGIFENMVFALSTSDKQRKKMESQILRAGGRILDDGFQPLFSHHDDDGDEDGDEDEDEDDQGQDRLRLVRPTCGFAALIADGHSRKAKFMQALALGLPCLAQQWITACVAKSSVLEWEPYLLAAGPSAVLGNAVRSRVLTAYPASTARLADVTARRRRPLAGQSVLVLSFKKTSREAQFLFLVRAMGPSRLVVVARQRGVTVKGDDLSRGSGFDWLYVGGGGEDEERGGKARVRVKGMRVLTEEIVVQSLILGRMVDEGEM